MDLVAVIRHKVHAEGVPIREVARELGLSRNTIRRYARAKRVPIDRSLPERATPVRDGVAEAAASIWKSRRSFTAGKQRLTATRLWELLREAGHAASERTVRRLVAEFRSDEREVTVPLVYGAGEVAQVDFFEVWVELAGVRQKSWLFLMRLMHSGRDFAMLCAQQDTTWFLAAHVAAFTHFAGVIAVVAYDNLTAAVAKVLIGAPRVLRPRFAALAAHYAFEARFCRPGEGHDKGGVERRGGHIRWQHLVPIPRGSSLAEMSAALQLRLDAQHDRNDRESSHGLESAPRSVLSRSRSMGGMFARPAPSSRDACRRRRGLLGAERWCGQAVDLFVGIDTVTFALGDDTVCHRRAPFGGRCVDYRHLLVPLAEAAGASTGGRRARRTVRRPMAGALESALRLALARRNRSCTASRAMARTRRPPRSRASLARAINAAIADGSLVSTPRRKAAQEATSTSPWRCRCTPSKRRT